jgi:hypothetical protein
MLARLRARNSVFEYLMILLVGVLALTGAQWWVIIIGALGLSIDSCVGGWRVLKKHPSVPFDRKVGKLFVASLGNGLTACSMSYIAGYFLRTVLIAS